MHMTQPLTRSVALVAALIVSTTGFAQNANDAKSADETELIALLRSDAPASEKAIACKNLAIDGSSAAVPELANLLSDPQLASWSRIALEAIPGKAADEALLEATDSLQGELLVGTINSIGVRRNSNAVEKLATLLHSDDSEVASAAAVALGHIGNGAAAKSLRGSLASAPNEVRSSIALGCVLCAERFLAEGNSTEATEIYDQVRRADLPGQRIIEATRGAILARGDEGIPLLLEQFRSSEKPMFQLALGTAREFPGDKIDTALATEMSSATPERAALIIQAMADREETVVLAAVLKAAEQGPKQVRLSAIDALKRVGNDSCLAALLKIAIENDVDIVQTAKDTLAALPGKQIDGEIAALLPSSGGDTYPLLLELVGRRRIDVVEEVEKALEHSDKSVRSAALIALGETVSLNKLSVLISQVAAPKHPEDASVAQQALRAASVRMPDREACSTELTKALERLPTAAKSTLLEILSDVGGNKALATIAVAAKGNNPELQDTGSRLLGTWNSVDAAPVLLDLAKTAPAEKYQIRALRGYIGLARKFTMPANQRVEMCQNALDTAVRHDEKMLVLDVLKLHPSKPGLALAIKAKQIPDLNNEASEAAMVIAKKLSGRGVDVSELLSAAGLE